MPVINGVYTKDFPNLGRTPADADLIPIAEVANQVTYKTTVGTIFNAKISGTTGRLSKFTGSNTIGNSILNEIGNAVHLTNLGSSFASFGIINPGTPGDPGVDNDAYIGSTINNDFLIRVNNTEGLRIDTALRLKIANIPNAESDTDKFLVSDGGIVKYRSGLEMLSDLGAVPYTGATNDVDLGVHDLTANAITLDPTPATIPTSQGSMYFDSSDQTVAAVLNGTIMKIGEDLFFQIKNQTGSTIPKGTAVRFDGVVGASGRVLAVPFIANGSVPSIYFLGVTSEDIPNGGDGKAFYFGKIRGMNTNAYPAGTILYASTTVAGGFQTTAPIAPNNIISIAAVLTQGVANGTILVRPLIGSNINNDEGVKITSPVTGDILQYQSSGLWENKTANGAGFVTLGTTQTITGSKTFTKNLLVAEYLTLGIGKAGIYNTIAFGDSVLANDNSAGGHVALGSYALYANTTGINNTGVGQDSLGAITIGSYNTALGNKSGLFINSGADNITSSNSVYLGYDTRASASGNTNEIVIGSGARGNGSNTVTIGNSSITDNYLSGSLSVDNDLYVGGIFTAAVKAESGVNIQTPFGLYWKTNVRSGSTSLAGIQENSSGLDFYTNSILVTPKLKLFANGNLGLGITTDAGYKLDVNGTGRVGNVAGSVAFRVERDSNNRLDFYQGGGVSYIDSSAASSQLVLATVGFERMRITSGGNVLIGTTSNFGSGKLEILYNGQTQNALDIKTTHVDGNNIRFLNSSNSLVGRIYSDASSTSYITSSDCRLKQDLKEYNALELLSKIKTYDYEWKSDMSRSYGVLAHELQEVLPYAVFGEKDATEMQGVDYSKLVPILVKAIQELKAEIDTLKNK